MAGKKGMPRGAIRTCLRQQMWNSMRIMKRFTIPDILRTVPGATLANAYKYFGRIEKAGIIGKIGSFKQGRVGEFQAYALLKDIGPVMPVFSYSKESDAPQSIGNEENHHDSHYR